MKEKKKRFGIFILLTLMVLFPSAALAQGLSVNVIDVGQGLSVLLESDGHYALYDGGGPDYSSAVVTFLRNKGVRKLDYVIASHYDEDHINGLIGAMNAYDTGCVVTPDYEAATYIYQSFTKTLKRKGLIPVHPEAGDSFSLGEACLTVLSPLKSDYEEENSYSIVVKAAYKKNSVLLTGDATIENEEEMVRKWKKTGLLTCDLLVLGHHGSANSTSQMLLRYAGKKGAILSCGKDNTYGHPAAVVMERLKRNKIPVYRTDRQGDLHFWTDGAEWKSEPLPCNDYSSDKDKEQGALTELVDGIFSALDLLFPNMEGILNPEPEEPASAGETDFSQIVQQPAPEEASSDTPSGRQEEASLHYVVNKATFKFHYPHCQSLSRMSRRNREDVYATRDEMLSSGYIPCQMCMP